MANWGKNMAQKKPKPRKSGSSTAASEAARAFMDLIHHFSYQQGPKPEPRELTNFTFFVGAGFSKSWDIKAPVGSELFSLKTDVIEKVADTAVLSRMFGIDTIDEITPEQLRQIVYQIDMYERYPEIRPRYVDDQNLRMFRGALRAAVVDRYDAITTLNYFDTSTHKFPLHRPTQRQTDILSFFDYLTRRIDGSQPFVEGIRTNFVTTNYDYVIETILDNVLAPDDSHFLYTYRGFTPIAVANEDNITPMHEHWLVQHLLKINGGFEIRRRGADYVLDYNKRTPADIRRDPPVLMLASREQDYTDPYFRTVFPKAVRLLRETRVLVIVGYSLPADDALLRFVLRQFAEEPEDGRRKAIFYISPGDNADKRAVLEEVFPSMADVGAPRLFAYKGGFDAFAAECLLLRSGH